VWDEVALTEPVFAFMCVQTPTGADGRTDLTYVRTAAAQLGPRLPAGSTVVNKSTLPVGSVRLVSDLIGRSEISHYLYYPFYVSSPNARDGVVAA